MEQVVKYQGEFSSEMEIPVVDRMVAVKDLVQESLNAVIAVFIQYQDRVYLAGTQSQVPSSSEIVRTKEGQICGIPAVTGG